MQFSLKLALWNTGTLRSTLSVLFLNDIKLRFYNCFFFFKINKKIFCIQTTWEFPPFFCSRLKTLCRTLQIQYRAVYLPRAKLCQLTLLLVYSRAHTANQRQYWDQYCRQGFLLFRNLRSWVFCCIPVFHSSFLLFAKGFYLMRNLK